MPEIVAVDAPLATPIRRGLIAELRTWPACSWIVALLGACATGLPIVVAVTEVAVAGEIMPAETASLLVAAGGVSVLLFPLLASLEKRVPTPRMIARAPGPAR